MTRLGRLLGALAVLAAVLALITALTDGFVLSAGSLRVSARSVMRPLVVCALFATGYLVLAGPSRVRRDLVAAWTCLTPERTACALTLGTVGVALVWNAWTAGGADAYAYVSQADLWLRGSLTIPLPIAERVPWPNGLATFTPYGYRAAPDAAAIVPVTAPGLPLLMAALKALAGHCAGFWVPPLTAGLLVWTTFLAGRRVASAWTGVAAAWLLATSPTVVAMAKSTMSDVPASAFWSLASVLLLAGTPRAACAAGLSASMAILIRPNLVPIAGVLALWSVWRDSREPLRGLSRSWAFGLSTLPGCLGVAWFNNSLYGSPLASGYGDLGPLFRIQHVPVNLQRFSGWLIDTQTPLAIGGLIALVVPWARLWPAPRAREALPLLTGTVVVVWAVYCAYTPFDAWWFLRFLLPCWMPLCVGMAVLVNRAGDQRVRLWRPLAALVLVLIGLRGVVVTRSLGVFPAGEGERRYATIAALVREVTDPAGVVITGQHAGAIRYYAGRLTLRFDRLDEAWLDRAVEWLNQQGRPAYILLEDWERPLFEQRFAAANRLGRLTLAPILAYRAHEIPGTVLLFDPLRPDGPTKRPAPIADPRPMCVPPAPAPPVDVAEPAPFRPGARRTRSSPPVAS